MDGLDLVCRSLYDVTLEHQQPAPGEVWSDSVYKVVRIRHVPVRTGVQENLILVYIQNVYSPVFEHMSSL